MKIANGFLATYVCVADSEKLEKNIPCDSISCPFLTNVSNSELKIVSIKPTYEDDMGIPSTFISTQYDMFLCLEPFDKVIKDILGLDYFSLFSADLKEVYQDLKNL